MRDWVLKKRSIVFHIVVTYFTCGIWAIIYLCCKSTQNNKEETYEEHLNNYVPTGNKDEDEYYRIEKQYYSVCTKHYKNIEKINMLYTVANNLTSPNSPEMQKVIELCQKDIELAPQIMNYYKELANYYKNDLDEYITNYVSFQKLAIIYEKRKEYQKAIDVCKLAIQIGFYKDGTAGQMPGRLARLIKKANKQNVQLKE